MKMQTVKLVFFFIFNLNFGDVYNLKILEMKIPQVADPREDLLLSCKFDMSGEKLYSVKWYKDEQEFFRYLPLSKPSNRFFTVPGVHINRVDCNQEQCDVLLGQLSSASSSGSYRCEISLDSPTFRVAFETHNLTVAALGEEDPQITGAASSYVPGDLVTATCTSSPSDPPAIIMWYVNGKQVSKYEQGDPQIIHFTDLSSKSVSLNFYAKKGHFPAPAYTMQLRCVAISPAVPTHSRSSTAKAILSMPSLTVKNQKLEWATNKGSGLTSVGPFLSVFILTALISKWRI